MRRTKQELYLERRIEELSKSRDDLQAKLKVALDRLSCIAEGSYYTSECDAGLSVESKNQRTAVFGLKIIANMRDRRL